MYLVTSNKLGLFQNFVAFSEYPNFLCSKQMQIFLYPTLIQSAPKTNKQNCQLVKIFVSIQIRSIGIGFWMQ